MRIHLLYLFMFLKITAFFPQSKVYTSIQENKKTYPEKNFFFSKVLDLRPDKSTIGIVYKTQRNAEFYADFEKPLSEEVFIFLKNTFPNTQSGQKIILVVNQFKIGHILSKHDTGFVMVDLDFYQLRNDSVSFVSGYKKSLRESADEVALSHSNRIKRALLLAVADFEKQLATAPTASFIPLTAISQKKTSDSLQVTEKLKPLKQTISYSQAQAMQADSLNKKNNYPAHKIYMIGGFINPFTASLMAGANFSAVFQLKKYPKYLLGVHLNYAAVHFYDPDIIATNSSYKLRTSDFGCKLLKQIKNNIFFNLAQHFLIGKETFTYLNVNKPFYNTSLNTTDVSSTFFGFQMDAGIYFMPPQKSGIYLGADATLRVTNSDVFESDIGLKFNLGAKF